MTSGRNLCASALVAACFTLISSPADAAWDIYPDLMAEAGVDNNVRMAVDNKDEALTYAGTASLNVNNVRETSEILSKFTVKQTEYSGTSLKGRTSFGARVNARKRTERIVYGVLADYSREPMLRSALVDMTTGEILGRANLNTTPDVLEPGPDDTPDADVDIGFEEQQINRQRARLSPWVMFRPGQRSRIKLGAELRTVSFGSTAETLGFHDTVSSSGEAQFQYQLSERDAFYIRDEFTRIDVDRSIDFDRNDAMVGWRRRMTETTRFLIEAGAGHVKSDTGADNTGLIARAQLWSELPRSQLLALVERRNYPTAFGDVLETNRLLGRWNYKLSERWSSEARALYQSTSSNVEKATFQERDYADLELRLSYSLTPDVQVGGYYRLRWIDRVKDTKDTTSNGAFLFVSYSPARPY